ncbi:VanW family protein [Candidatus Uhrbacteria bacterium]|nr:VanW family protein [Candidatus Uhrbacteria bacterium]
MTTVKRTAKQVAYFTLLGTVFFVFVCTAAGLALVFWAKPQEGRIAPGTWIGDVSVGGLTPQQAQEQVEKQADRILTEGMILEGLGQTATLPLSTLVGSDLVEDVEINVRSALDKAQARANHKSPLVRALLLAQANFFGGNAYIPVEITLHEDAISANIARLFAEKETPVTDAGFLFTKQDGNWVGEITPASVGTQIDLQSAFTDLTRSLTNLRQRPITLVFRQTPPTINESEARTAVPTALSYLSRAPITLTIPADHPGTDFILDDQKIALLLTPGAIPGKPIAIDQDVLTRTLSPLRDSLENPAVNASLHLEEGRVTTFSPSKEGVVIDWQTLSNLLQDALSGSEKSIDIPLIKAEPDVTVGELNDLGIRELLGVGTSSYRNSPTNRIRNIKNGVRLLNGLLIAPGETFSLISALKPFTLENGYYPELVIKGDKIEPELGGGLCQIGTTTFRATMMSGLPVKERRNHSLVVSYYNDPQNGNPGTDATIYEPAPDFKFENNTGYHVLFQAEVLEDVRQLRFSFWGTADGRIGSYSPPVVHRWIPVGEPVNTETTDLKPGEQKCQEAHVGADASFTYTITNPDGSTTDELFTSHYRPLPKICLVGATEPAPSDPNLPPADPLQTPAGETPLTDG